MGCKRIDEENRLVLQSHHFSIYHWAEWAVWAQWSFRIYELSKKIEKDRNVPKPPNAGHAALGRTLFSFDNFAP